MSRRFQINDKIGDYRCLGFIGQGGMGEVYHLFHEKLNRSVAAKVLGGNVGLDQSYTARFLNEARLQAALQHPNIAALYDYQEVGNELLIFMELVDGECLDKLVEERYFSIEESLKVFESIVSAIGYVHANGIIHRYIKAENVKLNSNGVPKLLDFGIAKDPGSQNLTQAGGVIGTPNYLAPEQLEGKSASVQTDIWALGVLLYKMLTGRLPFEHASFDSLLVQISFAKFEQPEMVNSAIPKAAAGIIKKCLAKDLTVRYQTADELLQDVRRVLRERYSGTHFPVELGKNRDSAPAKLWLIVASGLFLMSFIGLGIWAISGSNTPAVQKNPVKTADNQNMTIEKKSEPMIAQTDKRGETASKPADPGKNKRNIRIDAVGGTAEVWRNGQKIGNTPLDLEIAEKEVVNLKLKRQDSLDTDVNVEATVGKKVYTFSLAAK